MGQSPDMNALKTLMVLVGVMVVLNARPLYGQTGQTSEKWVAPVEADTLINPYAKEGVELPEQARDLYLMVCATCHGEQGDGGGGAGQAFNPPPADLTTVEVQKQSDGALFRKISEGRPPGMLGYRQILSDEERWQLVTYLRTFAGEAR